MKSKRIACIAMAGLMASSLAGCGGSDSDNKDTTEATKAATEAAGSDSADDTTADAEGIKSYADIQLGTDFTDLSAEIKFYNNRTDMDSDDYGGKNWKQYLEDFNKEYPNIKVDVITDTNYAEERKDGYWNKAGVNSNQRGEQNMNAGLTREEALALLKKYNKDPFHIQHAFTVEAVMKWYAQKLGYGEEAEFWGIVGLLHDIDFELYPAEHCLKAPEMLREGGATEEVIHGVVSHGYGITVECGTTLDVAPEHEMEKVLFAADELTGLIWAAALMRPSKSTKDMELKSLKKKYKSKGFAAGCSREVIERGAEQLGWELDELLAKTLQAMAAAEDEIQGEMEQNAE